MNTARLIWVLVFLVVANLGLSIHLLTREPTPSAAPGLGRSDAESTGDVGENFASLQNAVQKLSNEVETLAARGADEEMGERIAAVESGLEQVRKSIENLDFKKISEERNEIFRGELGYEKADEFMEAGAFAVAGNGYLQFLEANPEHPDARNIMHRARDAFARAGYNEKALWVQEEVIKNFPEFAGRDKYVMAMMLRKARRYDEALAQMEESVDLAKNDTERINRAFYRAYLIHQRDGNHAGVQAYRDLSKDIAQVGFTDQNVGKETLKRIADLESRLANGAE